MGPLKRGLQRAAAVGLGLLLALLLGEAGVRIWGGEARLFADVVGRTAADLPVHAASPDPELLYAMVPGFDADLNLDSALLTPEEASVADEPRRITTNAAGFRDHEWPAAKEPGTLRVLCFGGSNTYGAAVSQGRTWPDQLEAVLHARGHAHVDVWNLGVDGYKTRQKLRLAEIAVQQYAPDLLLFQLANTGPRLVLDGMQEQPQSWLDPSAIPPGGGIYRENLIGFPAPGSLLFAVARRSALLRIVLIATERLHRRDRPGDQPHPLTVRADTWEGAAFARFVDELPPSVTPVIFVPPAGGRPPWLRTMDIPLVDTRYGTLPDRVDITWIHPGAGTYRWYAERLADALESGGCLEPTPDRGVRCTGLDRTSRPEPDLH